MMFAPMNLTLSASPNGTYRQGQCSSLSLVWVNPGSEEKESLVPPEPPDPPDPMRWLHRIWLSVVHLAQPQVCGFFSCSVDCENRYSPRPHLIYAGAPIAGITFVTVAPTRCRCRDSNPILRDLHGGAINLTPSQPSTLLLTPPTDAISGKSPNPVEMGLA